MRWDGVTGAPVNTLGYCQAQAMVLVQEVGRASSSANAGSKLPGKGDTSGEENLDLDDYYTDEDEQIEDGSGGLSIAPKRNSTTINGQKTYVKGQKSQFIPLWLQKRVTGVWRRMCELYRLTRSLSWICTTTLLLVGLPVLFAYDRDKNSQDQQLMLPADTL
jgi:hypothetical protein